MLKNVLLAAGFAAFSLLIVGCGSPTSAPKESGTPAKLEPAKGGGGPGAGGALPPPPPPPPPPGPAKKNN